MTELEYAKEWWASNQMWKKQILIERYAGTFPNTDIDGKVLHIFQKEVIEPWCKQRPDYNPEFGIDPDGVFEHYRREVLENQPKNPTITDEVAYKIGDKLEITCCIRGHEFSDGEEVVIIDEGVEKIYPFNQARWLCRNTKGHEWFVSEEETIKIKTPHQEQPKNIKIYDKSRDSIDNLLSEQHRNTRHDAVDIVIKRFDEWIEVEGDSELRDTFRDDIIRDIHNMKQRKPNTESK